METKTILEHNRLIARFMGGKRNKETGFFIPEDEIWLPYHGLVNFNADTGHGKVMQYHESWDWLMPVVEKINMLDDDRYTIQILSMDVWVMDNQGTPEGGVITSVVGKYNPDELIKAVYDAVVGFINWHNTYKK